MSVPSPQKRTAAQALVSKFTCSSTSEAMNEEAIDELTEKSKRLPLVKDELEEKEMRWLELSEIDG